MHIKTLLLISKTLVVLSVSGLGFFWLSYFSIFKQHRSLKMFLVGYVAVILIIILTVTC